MHKKYHFFPFICIQLSQYSKYSYSETPQKKFSRELCFHLGYKKSARESNSHLKKKKRVIVAIKREKKRTEVFVFFPPFLENKEIEQWARLNIPSFLPFSSGQFSHSVVSDSLRPHELKHASLPCPSSPPGVYSNSCPSSHWCHPAISSSVIPFSSCPQSLPASVSFPMS